MVTPEESAALAARYYTDAMASFLAVPAEQGVNNFVIKGPHENPKIEYSTLIGLFSRPGINMSPEMPIVNLQPDNVGMVGWHNKILSLEVPQRVKDLGTLVDSEIELQFKSVLDSVGLPYAVLSVGKANGEEVVMLSCLWGANPEKVLAEFQAKSRERLRSIN